MMKKLILLSTIIFGAIHMYAQQKWNYPTTPKIPVYVTIWGKVIQDDYRWMEQPDNPMFEDWLKKQQAFTDSVMQTVPNQEALAADFKRVLNTFGLINGSIRAEVGKYAWTQLDARKDKTHKVYYKSSPEGNEEMIFDPFGFRPGTMFELKDLEFSPGGDWLRIGVSERGEDHLTQYFYNTKTKTFAADSIQSMSMYTKFYRVNGTDYVFYTGLNSENVKDSDYKLNLKVYVHKPGSNDPDILLMNGEKNPDLGISPTEILGFRMTDQGDHILIDRVSTTPEVALILLSKSDFIQGKYAFKNIVERSDGIRDYLINGNDLYFTLFKNGVHEVRVMSLLEPALDKSRSIFKTEDGWELSGINRSRDYMTISIQKNGLQSKNYRYSFATGKIEELPVPLNGLVTVYPLNVSSNEAIVRTLSWTVPPANYTYDLSTMNLAKGHFYHEADFGDMENIVVEEIEVPSHDGVMVPLSICYNKRYVKKDGTNTVFLNGYGAYSLINYPSFQGKYQFLFKRGIIMATAHVRGGGAKGDAWHKAGQKETKPNTWKDAIACAEWLVKNKYTSRDKMVIEGTSAGGIMAGMAMIERPDLFGVSNLRVGVLNPLRYEFTPNGQVDNPEMGSQKTEDGFNALYAMDAYQYIKTATEYPAQMITTGYNDPRVIVWMPAKFTAKMQSENAGTSPVLLQVNFGGGHSGAAALDEQFKMVSQEIAFLLWQTGHPDFQPNRTNMKKSVISASQSHRKSTINN